MSNKNEEIKKKVKNTVIATTTAASVVVGGLYSNPSEIINPKPVVMQLDENFDEQIEVREKTPSDKIKDIISGMPLAVRVGVGIPLWIVGWIIITLIRQAVIPNIQIILVCVLIGLLFAGTAVAIGKMINPDVSWKRFLNKKTLIMICLTVLLAGALYYFIPKVMPENVQYLHQIVIAMCSISLACVSAQLIHDFKSMEPYRIIAVTDDNLTIESK